jgi:hypothetical protein
MALKIFQFFAIAASRIGKSGDANKTIRLGAIIEYPGSCRTRRNSTPPNEYPMTWYSPRAATSFSTAASRAFISDKGCDEAE